MHYAKHVDINNNTTFTLFRTYSLYCPECGEDTGYSNVFQHQDGSLFLCDSCLETNHGHMDCDNDQCLECRDLGRTLRLRWSRRESLRELLRSDGESEDLDLEVNSSTKAAEPEINNNDDNVFKVPEVPPPRMKDVSVLEFSEEFDPDNVMQCSSCKMVYDIIERGIISKKGSYTCSSCIKKFSENY